MVVVDDTEEPRESGGDAAAGPSSAGPSSHPVGSARPVVESTQEERDAMRMRDAGLALSDLTEELCDARVLTREARDALRSAEANEAILAARCDRARLYRDSLRNTPGGSSAVSSFRAASEAMRDRVARAAEVMRVSTAEAVAEHIARLETALQEARAEAAGSAGPHAAAGEQQGPAAT